MDSRGEIRLEGLEELTRALEKCDKEVCEAAMQGMEAGAANIIADAQTNLRANGSVVTGLLRQSGKVSRKGNDIEAGFFDTQNRQTGYAEFVEYGRRAGRMPPVDLIMAWVYKKFHLKDWKAAKAIAWPLAIKIAREGTQPHPFFVPAVKKNQQKILDAIRKAVQRKTK